MLLKMTPNKYALLAFTLFCFSDYIANFIGSLFV
jgi:hypothetical protein